MNRVRAGIVGTGGIFFGYGGDSGHVSNYPWVEESKLCAICDISKENLEKALNFLKRTYEEQACTAEEKGDTARAKRLRADAAEVKTYTDLKEMISKEGLGLIDICSAAGSHTSISIQALKSGCNVTCEKPMGTNWLECMDVVEAVAQTGKIFQYGENWVFADPWSSMKKLIDAGHIGEPLIIFFPSAIGAPGSFRYTKDSVGSLLDMAIHAVTTSWYLSGFERRPVKVKAVGPHGITIRMKNVLVDSYREMSVEDDAHIAIEFEDKTTGAWTTVHVEGSWSYQDSRDFIIMGSNGSIQRGENNTIKVADPFGNSRQVGIFHAAFRNDTLPLGFGGQPQQLKNMCTCIINGSRSVSDEHIGAESMAIAGAAYLSQLRGMRSVEVDEFKKYALKIKKAEGNKAPKVLTDKLLECLKNN